MITSPLLSGALAGLVATVPMTVVMQALHEQLPQHERYPLPPSEITEQVTAVTGLRQQIDEQEHIEASLALHFAVGTSAGALYGPLASRYRPNPIVGGMAFGLAVWAVGYLGLLPALGVLTPATEHPPRRTALMIAAHLVWGGTLGILTDQLTQNEDIF